MLYHLWRAIVSFVVHVISPSLFAELTLSPSVELPVFLVLYLSWRLLKRSQIRSLKAIDLDTGRFVNTAVEEADDTEVQRRESGRFGWAWRMYSWVA